MPGALFAAEILEATAAIDEIMAESWQLLPRMAAAEVVDSAAVDTTRPSVTFQATYINVEAKPEEPNSFDRRQVRRPGIESGRPHLKMSAAARAATLVRIDKPDILIRLADGTRWSVSSSFLMPGGTLCIHVNIVG